MTGKTVLVELPSHLHRDLVKLLTLAIQANASIRYDVGTAHFDNHQWWCTSGCSDEARIQVDAWDLLEHLEKGA